jgi:hypothetical protein
VRSSALAAGVGTIGLALAAMQPPEARTVHELTDRLLKAGVPVGVIVPTRVWRRGLERRRDTMAAPALKTGEVPLLLRRFIAANPALLVSHANTVVRIRRVDEPLAVRHTLDRVVPVTESCTLSAVRVLLEKVMPIVVGEERGLVGGGVGVPGPALPRPRACRMDEDIVRVEPGSPTIPELLDSTVAQVPGLGWRVTYDADAPNLDLQIGLSCGDGTSIAVTDLQ